MPPRHRATASESAPEAEELGTAEQTHARTLVKSDSSCSTSGPTTSVTILATFVPSSPTIIAMHRAFAVDNQGHVARPLRIRSRDCANAAKIASPTTVSTAISLSSYRIRWCASSR